MSKTDNFNFQRDVIEEKDVDRGRTDGRTDGLG